LNNYPIMPRPLIWGRAVLGCIAIIPLLIAPNITGIMVDHGGMTPGQAGLIPGYSALGAVTMALVCALFMHHLPLQKLAAAGLLLAAATNAASAYSYQQHEVFYLLRTLNGFGDGAIYAAVMSSYAREQNSERCYGLFMMLQFGLSAIAMYTLPTSFPELNAEQLYLGICAFNLGAFPLIRLLPQKAALAEGISIRASEWRLLITVPALAGLGALCFFETSNTASSAYVERIAVMAGLSDGEIGSALGISSMLAVPGAFMILWLGSRFGHARPVLAGIAIGGCALWALLQANSYYSYLLAISTLSITWAFTLPYVQSVLADQDRGGAVVAAGGIASGAGGGMGPAMASTLVTANDYSGVLLVGFTGYALSATFIILVLMHARRHARLAKL
jgi:hypothetical protein